MGYLIAAQLRLVTGSFVLWTLLGLFTTVFFYTWEPPDGFNRSSSFDLGGHSGISPLLGFLAAALGVRLFARELQQPLGMYWRQLPVAPRAWFWLKLGVGTSVLLASMAVFALWYGTGFAHLVQTWVWGEYVVDPTPSAAAWGVITGWLLLTFVVTVYFASAFDRAESALQAGVPGFLAATVLIAADVGTLWGNLPNGLVPVVAGGVALVAAIRLWPARAVTVGKPLELLRTTPRQVDWPWLLAAQAVLVILPLCSLINLNVGEAWPYFGLPVWLGNALAWVVLGLGFLPWILLDVRRLQLRGGAAARVFALGLTGVGYLLWRAVRPRDRRDQHAQIHCSPMAFVSLAIAVAFVGLLAFGGQRYARAWHIAVDQPGVEILLDGEPVGEGPVRGVRWGGRLGHGLGIGTTYGGTTAQVDEAALRVSDLAAQLRRAQRYPPDEALYVDEALGPERVVELRRDGEPVPIEKVRIEAAELPFRVRVHLFLEAQPER